MSADTWDDDPKQVSSQHVGREIACPHCDRRTHTVYAAFDGTKIGPWVCEACVGHGVARYNRRVEQRHTKRQRKRSHAEVIKSEVLC